MNFSTQLLNESFNKILNKPLKEDMEFTEDSLRHALEDARDNVARKNLHGFPEIKAYEIAFQDVIESYYPDMCWWDVTDCQIFMELMNSGCDANAVINCIMDNLKVNDENLDESFKNLKESYRNVDGVEMIWHGTQSDPELEYDGYKFNYWDIEDAMWSNFLEENPQYSDSDSNDPECDEEFNAYCQSYLIPYLEDVIAGGYFTGNDLDESLNESVWDKIVAKVPELEEDSIEESCSSKKNLKFL